MKISKLLFLVFMTVSILSISKNGLSASLKPIGSTQEKSNSFQWPYKDILLKGKIVKGDVKKITSLIGDHSKQNEHIRIILDSPGGNFEEAIKIALLLHKKYISTYIPADSKCLSSCSIIFMAGSQHNGDGNRILRRTIHPTAVLGFHAPFILGYVPDQVSGKLIQKAYKSALIAASQFLRVSSTIDWPNSLTLALLKMPRDKYLYIDSVGKAGRWGIDLDIGHSPEILNKKSAFQICQNYFSWNFARQQESRANSALYTIGDESFQLKRMNDGTIKYSFPQEMGTDCEVIYRDGELNVFLDNERKYPWEPKWWHLYQSDTQLSSLIKKVKQITNDFLDVSDLAESGRNISYWTHNRSVMRFEFVLNQSGYTLEIFYEKPRAALNKHGIYKDTLLFSGSALQDGYLTGTARIFRRDCPPATYSVNGRIDPELGKHLVLWGVGKRWNGGSCKSIEYPKIGVKSGKLIFDLDSRY